MTSLREPDDEIWRLELTELAELIRTRQLKSQDVTDSTLRRIERLDPRLKSYAYVTAEAALSAARAADAEIARGRYRGVLHGVPIGVKDLCYTADAPTVAGTNIFRDFRPSHDATVVARLRAAGAVIVGKLAMTEGAYLGYHPSAEIPVNPWNAAAWAGVSSSGCGVATAAGLCFGSIGSDTGGSIRFPASACGVTGLKPTWGRVSRHGIVELAATFDHVGPIARSALDAGAMLTVIAGPDPRDPTSSPEPVVDYAADLTLTRSPRVGVDWAQLATFDEDTTSMLAYVVETLTGIGWPVVEIELPALDRVIAAFAKLRAVETARAHAETYPSRAGEYGPIFSGMLEAGRAVTAQDYQGCCQQRREFTASLRRVFRGVDLLLLPSRGIGAATVAAMQALGQDAAFTAATALPSAPFNMSGHPAISLPAGVTRDGIPIGFQFIGPEFRERFLVSAGHAFQQVTTFHRRRPQL
ncbi:MAG: Asp-tRNA(Asn)/Glu-tRNA(Gln) amidotransferase GatCAB subunit A [Mycobacterium sp.]|nr:MAG: Asp-tRNA(Asn)/Glu-tRNA(Gln) amidotransferase GatCAB subunit A [Mycobacterium sp.]